MSDSNNKVNNKSEQQNSLLRITDSESDTPRPKTLKKQTSKQPSLSQFTPLNQKRNSTMNVCVSPLQLTEKAEGNQVIDIKTVLKRQNKLYVLEHDTESDDDSHYIPQVITPMLINSNQQQKKSTVVTTNDTVRLESSLAKFLEDNPPMPLIPKSCFLKGESPRLGGKYSVLKLSKFGGKDFGKSKMNQEEKVEKFKFPPDVTSLKQVFSPIDTQTKTGIIEEITKLGQKQFTEKDIGDVEVSARKKKKKDKIKKPEVDLYFMSIDQPVQNKEPLNTTQTMCGEIVYLKSALDFESKSKESKRDCVLEDNLLDVRNLLKNSAQSKNKAVNETIAEGEKKPLIKVNIDPYYTRKSTTDPTLIFESRFESGNLAAAVKVDDNDYHLLLQNDVNTNGNTQWYFFKASNLVTQTARFNFLNLCKPDSLYNEGMKILVYSEKMANLKDIGWHRAGSKIGYYSNGLRRSDKGGVARTFYTMTFSYTFEHPDDSVYFAYSYPYTYSDMMEDLNQIMTDPIKSQFCARKTLCQTLAGNKCDYLTITSSQAGSVPMQKRKGVVISARVHPGETVASWMMKGSLDFLTDTSSAEAELLRQNFVFKVIPMLNADGVINGNYRSSLAGCDLNRRWKAPSKSLHPEIYHTKQLIINFAKERELAIFCDYHGHSRRKNIFVYGCNIPNAPEESRLLPFILGAINPFFVYPFSRFGNQKNKDTTARMTLFNELKNHPCIYTMESSFCGNDQGPYASFHFSTENLMQTGIDFCRAILIHQSIPCTLNIIDGLLRNINGLFTHYKTINDSLGYNEKDPDVELMKEYDENLKMIQSEGVSISTKWIKKALYSVLQQHRANFNEGETTSSQGSEKAPSEDNLEPEELAQVITNDQDVQQVTIIQLKPKVKVDLHANCLKEFCMHSPVKLKCLYKRIQRQQNTKGNGNNNEDDNSDQQESNCEQQKFWADDQINGKKKLKKNVESRDAYTQTERSDYLLIKQKQKLKEVMMMAKQGLLPPGITAQQVLQQMLYGDLMEEFQEKSPHDRKLPRDSFFQNEQFIPSRNDNPRYLRTETKPSIKLSLVGKKQVSKVFATLQTMLQREQIVRHDNDKSVNLPASPEQDMKQVGSFLNFVVRQASLFKNNKVLTQLKVTQGARNIYQSKIVKKSAEICNDTKANQQVNTLQPDSQSSAYHSSTKSLSFVTRKSQQQIRPIQSELGHSNKNVLPPLPTSEQGHFNKRFLPPLPAPIKNKLITSESVAVFSKPVKDEKKMQEAFLQTKTQKKSYDYLPKYKLDPHLIDQEKTKSKIRLTNSQAVQQKIEKFEIDYKKQKKQQTSSKKAAGQQSKF